ncbi:hypothetical protein CLV68_3768 [Actinokineospora cianjurensis]|uniref:Uncharacterized protein n=1 Tax=Actinokineospora cianjurensis TaxID=585224 RepID=A0A421B4C4_9PSEU|nr:hypothetical protein CLV68_3768 [Actinokineospora cianjurensis]
MGHLDDPGLDALPTEGVSAAVALRRKALNWAQRKLAAVSAVSLSLLKKVRLERRHRRPRSLPPCPALSVRVLPS